MNTWSEANFLERLMPPAELKSSAKKDPCPEDELLVAFSENRLGGFVWDAVAEHLTRCSECSELQHRLLKFSSASVATEQADWGQAEKRLENWMDAFLQSHAADAVVSERVKPALAIAGGEPVMNAPSWKFRWAWSAVAGLAAVACAAVVLEFVPALLHRGEPPVAMQKPTSAAPLVAAQSEPPAERATSSSESGPAQSAAKIAAPATPAGNQGEALESTRSEARAHSSAPAAHRETADRDGAKLASERVSDAPPATESSPVNPADQAIGTATRAASQLASAVGAAIDSASGDARTSHGSARTVANSGARSAATRSALPASISLLESTPIRVQLTSGSIPSDGSFEFQGTLLDPAIPVIGLVLGRDKAIRGVGTVQNGEISVVIKEVIIRGVRYPLKEGSGAGTAHRVDSGDALQVSFDQGSVYEKVSRANGAPAAASATSAGDDGRF